MPWRQQFEIFFNREIKKWVARQRLGRMLSEVDREIDAGKPMRDFEETFAAIQKRNQED